MLLDPDVLVREFMVRQKLALEPPGWAASVAAEALKPLDPISVWEWADAHRILTSVDTDEAGPWRTLRTPYLREIMQSLSLTDPCRVVVFMKGAQIGATQCGNNFVGYAMHHAPGPMLIALPTVELAKRNSRQRIEPMIESCPELAIRAHRATMSDKSQNVLQKSFDGGGLLIMTGANSAVGLRSMSCRYLMMDEIDGWPQDADGEGDPVALAIARTRNFQRAKIYMCSTPTVFGLSRIEAAFLRGTRKYYHVPCPHCGFLQPLRFGGPDCDYGLKWTKDLRTDVVYLCASKDCGRTFEERFKTTILPEGAGARWVATAEDPKPGIESYHLSSIYSPYGWYGWNQLRDDFLEAKEYPLKLKGFVNTVLGESFRDDVSLIDADDVMKRREKYPVRDGKRTVPLPVVVMTGGVDVHDDRIELQVLGWGLAEECWVVEYDVIPGNPGKPEIWRELWERMTRLRPLARGGEDYVRAWCVDTAGHHTDMAYEFCRPRYRVDTPDGRKILTYPIVGRAGPGHLWQKPSRNSKAKIILWIIRVDAGKERLYSAITKIRVPGPGYIHFHDGLDESFFAQLAAEQIVHGLDPRGFPTRTWQLRSPGRRNESLDTWVYAYAALMGLVEQGFALEREARDLLGRLARLSDRSGPVPDGRSEAKGAETLEVQEGVYISAPMSEDGGVSKSPEQALEVIMANALPPMPARPKSWQRRRIRSHFLGRRSS